MEHFEIMNSVYWVGKIDWELRKFHGDEYNTMRGSTYNSYLVKDQKVALIDTVWEPFAKEYVHSLSKTIDLNKIDYIIANHAEIDHSGALTELMKVLPDRPIYCTKNGIKSLKGHYHKDWNFIPVKTGDKLSLGNRELVFIEAPMLHWPDSMFCYLTKSNILFSNDAFGQHYASEYMYNDLVSQAELWSEAIKYYANILTPFSSLVKKKIDEVLAMKLPLTMICPSHGVLWRREPSQIVEKYLEWASDYKENQITIVYDTMWNATRRIAESIADGIILRDPAVRIKVFNAAKADKTEIITEIFKSRTVLMGSSTINRGILNALGGLLEQIRGLGFKGKNGASFSSYGWSGEAKGIIEELLNKAGFTVIPEGPKVMWYPGDEDINNCKEFGKMVAGLGR
ncbi:MAG TPA: anaerobic nitric oxide reductase flavorubredoxin [Chitinispirillaceae bacterium]|nr:anaerobic nitric oxide reductase flavorubredoxin [Chitinispirillaceae bacterium]